MLTSCLRPSVSTGPTALPLMTSFPPSTHTRASLHPKA